MSQHVSNTICWFAEFCENLLNTAGVRFAGPIAILRNWTFCLFYVMAELWGSVVVSLLFWGFANQVSSEDAMPLLIAGSASAPQMLSAPLIRLPSYADHHGG